jgi:hypothetical protein
MMENKNDFLHSEKSQLVSTQLIIFFGVVKFYNKNLFLPLLYFFLIWGTVVAARVEGPIIVHLR